jgi:ankyrin repeat protein
MKFKEVSLIYFFNTLSMGVFNKIFNLCPSVEDFLEWAMNGNIDIIIEYINKWGDINAINQNHMTALHWACKVWDFEIVELLIENWSKISNTYLSEAALIWNIDMINLLLEYWADLNKATIGPGPLSQAWFKWDIKLMKFLIEKWADVNARSGPNSTPLIDMIRGRNLLQPESLFMNELIESWKVSNTTLKPNINVIKLLLEHGADPDFENTPWRSALKLAKKHWRKDMVKLLEMYGA